MIRYQITVSLRKKRNLFFFLFYQTYTKVRITYVFSDFYDALDLILLHVKNLAVIHG